MRDVIYETATNSVIKMLDTAGKDWKRSWSIRGNRNIKTNNLYRGVNSFLVGAAGFDSPFWGTYNQWKSKKSYVKRGEKATPIVFFEYMPWKNIDGSIRTKKNGDPKYYRLMREYSIFNYDQTGGQWHPPEMVENENKKFDHVDTYIANTDCEVKYGQDQACYSPLGDYIGMPDIEQFDSSEEYYGVFLHELIHWTGIKDRCNRCSDYAFEELVAELGSIFLGMELEVQVSPQPSNVKYLNNWLEKLEQDKSLIFSASGHAQHAVNYCNKLQESTMVKAA